MGWEFRFFVQLPAGSPGTGSPGAVDIFSSPRQLCDSARGPEERADVYVDVRNAALGVKFRGVDPRSGSGGRLELKVRTEAKKRCAEKWAKQRSNSDDLAGLLRGVDPAAAAAAGSAARVLLRKSRWSGHTEGVSFEQTDLEILVRQPAQLAEDARPRAPGGQGSWSLVPRRYRTICFEGRPADCYALAARWLQLPDEWEVEHLSAGLDPSVGRVPVASVASVDGTGTESENAAHLPTLVVGGYPQFIATLVASLPGAVAAAAPHGQDSEEDTTSGQNGDATEAPATKPCPCWPAS